MPTNVNRIVDEGNIHIMVSKNLNEVSKKYLYIIALNVISLATLRIVETTLILLNFGVPKSLFQSEILGLIFDLIITNTILAVVSPLFYLTFCFSEKAARRIFVALIAVLSILHFFILKYFLYQLIPLDTFLFKYSIQEILFTINTSDISYVKSFFLLITTISIIYFSNKFLNRKNYLQVKSRVTYFILSISVLATAVLYFSDIQLTTLQKTNRRFSTPDLLLIFFKKMLIRLILQRKNSGNFSNYSRRSYFPIKIIHYFINLKTSTFSNHISTNLTLLPIL